MFVELPSTPKPGAALASCGAPVVGPLDDALPFVLDKTTQERGEGGAAR
jgi:hypothetical protein